MHEVSDMSRPELIEILMVEDNPGDVRLTREALRQGDRGLLVGDRQVATERSAMTIATRHILLVEDSPGDAHLIQGLLRKAKLQGFDIERVGDLAGALQRLVACNFDAVLLDLSLPDSAGMETFVRVQAEAPDVPIVILTGLDDEDTAVRTVGAGAQDYLVKGQVQRPLLVRALQHAIERKEVQRSAIEQFKLAETFFNHSVSCLVILDRDYNFVRVNEAYARACRRDITEFAGRNHFDMYPSDTKLIFDEVVRTKRPFETLTRAFVFPEQPERGVTYWDWTLVPILDHQGEVEYLVFSLNEVTERKRAEEALRKSEDAARTLNAELEQHVRERTAQLEAVNTELEAFSYSVSHDLRAPLRAIDGFSKMLLDRYAERLEGQGQHYLHRVREGAQRMDELINDLLTLSRLTRAEIHWESVDLTALTRAIVAQLQAAQPERRVECVITDGVVAQGDPGLIRVALENLLGNAWKYTNKHATARIEFGITQENGQRIYLVRDDGAGFDMAYVDKLFGAFQRLHGAEDFEGTGIGLATVQRIIRRHGGRVWAEGAVEGGATFYFTIPANATVRQSSREST
jgi:PAS domain S-box-containing protein